MALVVLNNFQKFLVPFLFVFLISFPSFISVSSAQGPSASGAVLSGDIGGVFVLEQQKELRCLESALWLEARSEPEAGIRAVMSVIYNRELHKDYPDSFCGVIMQHRQFSAFDNNKGLATEALKPIGSKDKKAYDVVSYVAHQAILGAFKPVLDRDVLWYTNVRIKNSWTKHMKVVKIVKSHKFLKE